MAGLRITKNKWVKYDSKWVDHDDDDDDDANDDADVVVRMIFHRVTIEISCQMDFSEYPFDRY